MVRVKIKHCRPRQREIRIQLVDILGRSDIYVTRIITLEDGFVVLTKDDKDADKIFQEESIRKLNSSQFYPTLPADIKARKTVLCFNVDSFIYDNSEDEIKQEMMHKNLWSENCIEQVVKFPNRNIMKVVFTQTQVALKATENGIVAFNICIPSDQIKQEKFIPILTCMICYKMEDHTTKNCPKNSEYKICSECAEEGHSWKDCPSGTQKCINCGGRHRATAMKCPKRKEIVEKKRKEMEETRQQSYRTYSDATKSRPDYTGNVMSEKGTTAKIMTCLLLAHQYNMVEPGSFEKQLNTLLTKNNLPKVAVPSNPPSGKIIRQIIEEDNNGADVAHDRETEITASYTDKAQEETNNYAQGVAPENLREAEERQPTINCKFSGKKIGLQIITRESRGWPENGFDMDELIDGLQRRDYKWTYTSNELEEEEVFQKINRNEIDLKNCWTIVQDSTYNKIRSGHLKERSPLPNRDPRRRRGAYNKKSEVEDINYG